MPKFNLTIAPNDVILYIFLWSAFLRNGFLCWDCWNGDVMPTLDAALLYSFRAGADLGHESGLVLRSFIHALQVYGDIRYQCQSNMFFFVPRWTHVLSSILKTNWVQKYILVLLFFTNRCSEFGAQTHRGKFIISMKNPVFFISTAWTENYKYCIRRFIKPGIWWTDVRTILCKKNKFKFFLSSSAR